MDAVVDRFVVGRKHEKAIKAGDRRHAAGRRRPAAGPRRQGREQGGGGAVLRGLCAARRTTSSTATSSPSTSCSTTPRAPAAPAAASASHKLTHPELLVPDPRRSILGGCFVREAFKYNPDTWDGRVMYSLSQGAAASRSTRRGRSCPRRCAHAILYGIDAKKIVLTVAARREGQARRLGGQGGRLRRHRAAHRAALPPLPAARRGQLRDGGVARQGDGRAHLPRLQRRARSAPPGCCSPSPARPSTTSASSTSTSCTRSSAPSSRPAAAPTPAGRCSSEIRGRLELLLGIGLDYLNFNRRSGTLSGGESQRIRLSTQIGSGLMGMLYVLDEPSIGLHPKDNVKMIATLESLRDIGNTVIVVEHDEDTIRAADHIVEMGPGPGVHGGKVVVQGTLDDVLACKASPTGQFLSGKRVDRDAEAAPQGQRQVADRARRAREQSARAIDVDVPARHAGRDHRRLRLGQEHAGQRDPLQGAVEAAGRHAHAARRARRRRRRSSTCTRSSTSTSRRSAATAARIPRPTSASTTPSATCSRRRRCRSSAATRRAASAST